MPRGYDEWIVTNTSIVDYEADIDPFVTYDATRTYLAFESYSRVESREMICYTIEDGMGIMEFESRRWVQCLPLDA